MLKAPERTPGLEAFKLARQRERVASDKISQALVDSFITPIEREDIEALASALYKIPKQVERFADRYALARHRLDGIDFAPRAAMLEQAAGVVVEMVHELRGMELERMKQLNDRLRVLEAEADRLILELHRDIYSGRLRRQRDVPAARSSSRSWRRRSTAAARPATSPTRSCSRTAEDRRTHADPRAGGGRDRAGVRVHQRLPRHRQFDRDRRRDQGADAGRRR